MLQCNRSYLTSNHQKCCGVARRSCEALASRTFVAGPHRVRMYRIDPGPFEVELQSNEAALARANAVYDQAAQQARRVALLTSQRATTEVENEKAFAAMRQAEADVAGRKADVARAKLNLDYATIRAPIDGIVGAALGSEGPLGGQNGRTSLATIPQLSPVYGDLTQSVRGLHHLRRAL